MPGMSDFDARLIVRDGMTAEDWCRMSTSIGEAHLALCQKPSCWARNLEHLPGINLVWSELTSEKTYYPEYEHSSFYYRDIYLTPPTPTCSVRGHGQGLSADFDGVGTAL